MNKMTETNLEHYKEGLKSIFRESAGSPRTIYAKIKDSLDRNIASRNVLYYTDVILEWMAEPYKGQILDEVEKAYLSEVIKPFRKRVNYIMKKENIDNSSKEFIHIELSDEDIADFPDFKANTMYKGMKVGIHYTLQELGL